MNEQSDNSGQLAPDAGSGGDARAQFEAWADSEGLILSRHGNGSYGYERAATATAWGAWQAALAARQPVGVEPVAWQINATRSGRGWEACTRECYMETLKTGHYMGLPHGTTDVRVRALYTAPLAPAAVPVDVSPLIAYAESYRMMARMGDGKVDCLSVAADIENNMLKHATHPQPAAASVPDLFVQWLEREMPAGTIIGKPAWWAPKLARALRSAERGVLGGCNG